MSRLTVLIPCYNEAEAAPHLPASLLPTLSALRGSTPAPGLTIDAVDVLLVDDGSEDGTLAALQSSFGAVGETGVEVGYLRHPRNLGLGAALRTGLAAARGEVIVTTDSDGTYDFSEIPALLGCLQPGVDFVTASPHHPMAGVENVPAYRLWMSRGASLAYRLVVDRRIHTYTALFRAYRRPAANVPFEADGFLGVTELLVRSLLSGHRLAEYPSVLHARTRGLSKARLGRITLAHVRFLGQLLLQRLGGRRA